MQAGKYSDGEIFCSSKILHLSIHKLASNTTCVIVINLEIMAFQITKAWNGNTLAGKSSHKVSQERQENA